MPLEDSQQILKTRDDPTPLRLQQDRDEADTSARFCIAPDISCSWAKPGEPFGSQRLRQRIEPWLTALVQSEHLSVLVGSGLTHAIHHMATGTSAAGMTPVPFASYTDQINAGVARIASRTGRGTGNFEDQIRVANELLRGLEILSTTAPVDDPMHAKTTRLTNELTANLESFAESVLKSESGLVGADDDKRRDAVNYSVSFLMSFASRSGTRDRLHLFTTNYDRYLEMVADAAGLRLIHRFVGSLEPVFRASRLDVDLHYNPPGIRGEPRYLEGVARFTKLHGSVDWMDIDGAIRRTGLPFGAASLHPFVSSQSSACNARRLMIYPNAAKDRETSGYPYVELFRDIASSICRPNSTLVCYGYGFGDEHINRVIEDMLTIPSTHLVIISYDDPLDRILDTYRRVGRHAQVTLLLGDHLGDLRTLVDNYLPKPAIDRTTFRMADLLKARFGTEQPVQDDGENDVGTGEVSAE